MACLFGTNAVYAAESWELSGKFQTSKAIVITLDTLRLCHTQERKLNPIATHRRNEHFFLVICVPNTKGTVIMVQDVYFWCVASDETSSSITDHNFASIVGSTLGLWLCKKAASKWNQEATKERDLHRWCFVRLDCVLEKLLAKAAEVIIHWFWFNDNKGLIQPTARGSARNLFATANAKCISLSTLTHFAARKISTNLRTTRNLLRISLPLSSDFQSPALVYALFVLLACWTREKSVFSRAEKNSIEPRAAGFARSIRLNLVGCMDFQAIEFSNEWMGELVPNGDQQVAKPETIINITLI